MYENLRGYGSIDKLMDERIDLVQEGLNQIPDYLDLVKKMRVTSIGINVKRTDGGWSYFVSHNDPKTGKILYIDQDSNPDFSIKLSESKLLHIIDNADDLRKQYEEGELTIPKAMSYVGLILPGRLKDLTKVRVFVGLLETLINRYSPKTTNSTSLQTQSSVDEMKQEI